MHAPMSKSLMLITFTGRNSGRSYTTPVRYVRIGDVVRCFTSPESQWWRNLRQESDVVLRIEGEDKTYRAVATHQDADSIREGLRHYLALFPQDAAYHEIRLNADKSLVAEDLDRASRTAVMVEARPIS
jgi:deazaflavin-dependent oxidoreductase (nitroreductase family)